MGGAAHGGVEGGEGQAGEGWGVRGGWEREEEGGGRRGGEQGRGEGAEEIRSWFVRAEPSRRVHCVL